MRDFEFRAWDEINKSWIYSSHLDKSKSIGWFWDMAHKYKCVVEQWTGLYDKTGKKIFEGDILRMTYSSGYFFDAVVVWYHNTPTIDGEFGMQTARWVLLKEPDSNKDTYHLSCEEVRRVIGNIRQNPELLEKLYESK